MAAPSTTPRCSRSSDDRRSVLIETDVGAAEATFSTRLAGLLDAGLVHTDDVASPFEDRPWERLARRLVVLGTPPGGGYVGYRQAGSVEQRTCVP